MYTEKNYLDKSHAELVKKVKTLSENGGDKEALYRELLDSLTTNVAKEEVLLYPLMKYLKCRGDKHCAEQLGLISNNAYFFSKARDSMQQVMESMMKLVQKLEKGANQGSDESLTLRELREHLEIDNAFVYPAGMGAKALLLHDMDLQEWMKALLSHDTGT
ncbi:hypothetical protein Thermo_01986 [Thermoplasmatales archaeon]|nr:hypothetical protein Thermo_01986 [Thermoplasmatales archaeon]